MRNVKTGLCLLCVSLVSVERLKRSSCNNEKFPCCQFLPFPTSCHSLLWSQNSLRSPMTDSDSVFIHQVRSLDAKCADVRGICCLKRQNKLNKFPVRVGMKTMLQIGGILFTVGVFM